MRQKVKIAVIPAAGKGNRIAELPLIRILPKPMLPLVNKPIIEHIISWLKKVGVEKIYPVISFKKEIFKEYFGNGNDFGIKISYIECPDTENIGGIADGIYLAHKFIKEPFFVVLGDDFTITHSPEILVETFFSKRALAVEGVVNDNNVESLKRTCSVNLGKEGRILDIVEKPQEPKWKIRGCGIYLFDPIVFDFIEKTPVEKGRRDITKTIQLMAKKTGRVYGVPVDLNININTLADLHQATLALLKREKI